MTFSGRPLARLFVSGLFVILALASQTIDVEAFYDSPSAPLKGAASRSKTASESSYIPPEFQDLYPALQASLSSYNSALNSRWDGSKSPILLGAELTPADGYIAIYNAARTNELGAYYDNRITPFLNAYQAMGMTTVKFLIQFPMFYQKFYQSNGDQTGTAYNNIVAFYQRLVKDLHGRGIKVIIQSQVQPAGNGPIAGDPLQLASYYASFPDFASYVSARAANALAIAQLLQPDFLNFSAEPDTEGPKTGGSVAAIALNPRRENSGFVANVRQLQSTILSTLLQANLPGLHSRLKLVVGLGSWEHQLGGVLQNELGLQGIDIIDIHVHPINSFRGHDFLATILPIADAVRAAGKQVGMDEEWEYKERDSEFGAGGYGHTKVSIADIDARDHFSFWAPLDQKFLQAMVNTGYYEKMAYFSASEPNQFFAYLDYAQTPGCPTSSGSGSMVCRSNEWNRASSEAVYRALANSPASLTGTGSFYSGLIKSTPGR
jgi:hypothetical protein